MAETQGSPTKTSWHMPTWLTFSLQYVVMPILMLVVGYVLNGRIQQNRLDLDRIETAARMNKELFTLQPAEVFIHVHLMAQIVDKKMAEEIKQAVIRHYTNFFDLDGAGNLKFTEQTKKVISDVTAAEVQPGGEIAEEVKAKLRSRKLHLIVASLLDENAAIDKAQALREAGYRSEVYYSVTGYFGVTIGRGDVFEMRELFEKARVAGDAPADAYMHDGSRFERPVFTM
jgi:hypothetical protein